VCFKVTATNGSLSKSLLRYHLPAAAAIDHRQAGGAFNDKYIVVRMERYIANRNLNAALTPHMHVLINGQTPAQGLSKFSESQIQA
jgi:hypothetical protein